MSQRVKLELAVEDVDFIVTVLGSVTTLQTVQAGKLHLIPMIKDQATWSLQLQQKEAEEEAMRDKVRILREARQAAEQERAERRSKEVERDGFTTALGGENIPLRDILAEQARQMQNVAPGSPAYEEAMKQNEIPLTPYGESERAKAAKDNIARQHELRRKLDAIEKGG